MSLFAEIPNPYLEAFTVGLLYGLTVCTAECLPHITSYIARIGAGFRGRVLFTNRAPLFRKWISIFGGGKLILLGVVALLNAIIVNYS
jgi:hypothetical protein